MTPDAIKPITIEEAARLKRNLEAKILRELQEFSTQTGLQVTGVAMRSFEVQATGHAPYMVHGVFTIDTAL